jgi:CBS domain containing-hemolysin-like protein
VIHGARFTGADAWALVAIGAILVALAFLSLAEMGLSRMTKPKAAAMADRGQRGAKPLLRLVSEPERWVNPVLLSVNVLQTVQAFLTGVVTSKFGAVGAALGLVADVLVFFVLAESIPKTYAVLFPERAAMLTARPTLALVRFPPVRMVSKGLVKLTNLLIPGRGLTKGAFVSEHELLGIVEAAAEESVIEHEERRLIESIITFGDTVAREIMVPRPDIVSVTAGQTVAAALDVAIAEGYSRLPVLTADEDDVLGVAYTKDLVKVERQGEPGRDVAELARPVRFVPENKPVAELMREMQADKAHMTMVADEYGALSGLVTLEDCLEELVGDIVDEYDTEERGVEREPDGDYVMEGGTSISEVNELLDTELDDGEWSTLGGFIFGAIGHVPAPGDHIDRGGWTYTVEQMEGRRIRRVRVSVASGPEHHEGGHGTAHPHVYPANSDGSSG